MPSDDAFDLIRGLNMGYTPTDKKQVLEDDAVGSGKYKNAPKASCLLRWLPKVLRALIPYLDNPQLHP